MQWNRTSFLLGLNLVWVAAAFAFQDQSPQRRDVEANAEVAIELGFLDRAPAGGTQYSVAVRVLVDGTVTLPRDGEPVLARADEMSGEQLAGLLREVHGDGQLFATSSPLLRQQIEQACQAAGLSFNIDGAAETVIRCRTDRGLQEVRCPALSVMAARFPEFLALQRMHLTQLRLQNVAAVARAGGEAASGQLVRTANQSLRQTHPSVAPLTPRELSMVRELSTGNRYVQFYRVPQAGEDELLVSLFESPGTEPRVSVLVNPTQRVE